LHLIISDLMKAVIPVAGVGSKLHQPANLQPKTLITLADKPVIGHIIDGFLKVGIQDFVFIIGSLGYKVQHYIQTTYKKRIKADFVIQEPRLGSAHAIWTARESFKHETELVVAFGDTISSLDTKQFVRSKTSMVAVSKVDTPCSFGIVETDKDNFVKKFAEKPKIPKSNKALVGLYKINNVPLLLDSIGHNIESKRFTYGEYHLTDALSLMLKMGEKFAVTEVNHWYDCSRMESLLAANEILLKHEEFETVFPEEHEDTILIPPVSIGTGCKISNSIIGPYVAIGNNTTIQSCILQNSIVCSNSHLQNSILKKSVIGNDTNVKGAFRSVYVSDEASLDMQKD
jgi:glucose-1-phosphate thymidylyltransferase